MSKWVKQFTEVGNVNRKFSPGRPRITTLDQNIEVAEYLRQNPFSTATRASALQNIPYMTATRRIREQGINHCIAAHETKLTREHRDNRVRFYRHMLEVLREINFDKIIFTDEKIFCTDRNNKVYVYRPEGLTR